MIEFILFGVILAIGVISGLYITKLHKDNKDLDDSNKDLDDSNKDLDDSNKDLDASNKVLDAKNKDLDARNKDLDASNKAINERNLELEKQASATEEKEKADAEKIALLEQAEERLKIQFENTSNQIFRDRSKEFKAENEKALNALLNPLNDQIKDFKEQFTKTDKDFSAKFGELAGQINSLSDINKTIGEQAQELSSALKGDSKQQGDWGELILQRVLEMSGLREGQEYLTQVTFTEDGQRKVLDAIVKLPDNKDIIIDSKISLTNYTNYCNTTDDEQKQRELKEHIRSVEKHIKDLSGKNYQSIDEIRTLNYVLMFLPVEPAYILLVGEQPGIFKQAMDKNIILVCPSTLFAVLKTIHSLWQLDSQNKNAREIAQEAGKLYDKLVTFTEKMDKLGKQIDTIHKSYDDAYGTLKTGRGNLIRKAESIRQLGAKTNKLLPTNLITDAQDNDSSTVLTEQKDD